MKKTIFTFGLLLMAAFTLNIFSQTGDQPQIGEGATMVFEKETHDYGKIEQHSNGIYEFVFTNTGSEELTITYAKGSCGCTVPDWPRESVAPGATGVIKVEYDTKRIGLFNKTVTITSNATNVNNGTSIIRIQGEILNPADEATPEKDPAGPVSE